MKPLVFLLCLSAGVLVHAGQDGNGGFGLKCGSKVDILDLYEAKHVHHLNVNLGAPNLSVQDKIKIMLDRMAKWMPAKASDFQNKADEFFPVHGDMLGNRVVIVSNKEAIKEGQQPSLDIGNTIVPTDCDIVAMARNFTTEESPTGKPRAYIFTESWNLANNDSKAILMLHELFYMQKSLKSSQDVRRMMAYLMSDNFDQLTYAEWQKMAENVIGIEYRGIIVLGWIEYRESGLPEKAHGYLYTPKSMKYEINGTVLDFKPTHGFNSPVEFNEMGEPLSGFVIPSPQEKIQFKLLNKVSVSLEFDPAKQDFNLDAYVRMYKDKTINEVTLHNGARAVFETSDKVKISARSFTVDRELKRIIMKDVDEKLSQIVGGPDGELKVTSVVLDGDGNVLGIYPESHNGLRVLDNMTIYNHNRNYVWSLGSGYFKMATNRLSISGDLAFYYRNKRDKVFAKIEINIGEVTTRQGSDKLCVTTIERRPNSNNSNWEDFIIHTKSGKKFTLPKHERVSFTIDGDGIPLSQGCSF